MIITKKNYEARVDVNVSKLHEEEIRRKIWKIIYELSRLIHFIYLCNTGTEEILVQANTPMTERKNFSS